MTESFLILAFYREYFDLEHYLLMYKIVLIICKTKQLEMSQQICITVALPIRKQLNLLLPARLGAINHY
jgi:hypothetical protein